MLQISDEISQLIWVLFIVNVKSTVAFLKKSEFYEIKNLRTTDQFIDSSVTFIYLLTPILYLFRHFVLVQKNAYVSQGPL
jgi:hypothetical protein